MKNSTAYTYADDTAIIVSHKCIRTAERIMQHELNQVVKWCHDNGLVINSVKTKLMHIRPKHIPQANINITFHNTECLHRTYGSLCDQSQDNSCKTQIEVVDNYKYLGVHLDKHFKWKTHIEDVQKKLRKSSYALYHLSNCAPFYVLKQAYFSLAESYVRHGITAWGSAAQTTKLQHTQNRLLKILSKSLNRTQSNNTTLTQQRNDLNKYLQILNIKSLYKTTILSEFSEHSNLLERINHQQNTRRRALGRFNVPSFKNDYGKHSLTVRLPSTLNELPAEFINIRHKIKRNKIIKTYYLNNQ